MKKIRICMILNTLRQGGAEKQFVELANRLNKDVFDVTVYLFDHKVDFFELNGINLIKDNCSSNIKGIRSIKAVYKINRFLNKNDFNILYTSLFWNSLLVRMALPSKYDLKIVTSIRSSFSIYNFFHRIIEKFFYRKSYIITNSKKASADFKLYLKKEQRIFYIYNGYDILRFLFKKSHINTKQLCIGTVGRQTHIKNQLVLLKALESANLVESEVLIIGALGDASSDIQNYLQHSMLNVKVLDAQKNIEEYYKKFDIFVLPSQYEGCPNVLFEAMLASCFCIVSEGANTDGYITHGVNGLIYDGSIESLKNILNSIPKLIESPRWDEIRYNGQQYAIDNFSMGSMVSKYESLFMQIHNKEI